MPLNKAAVTTRSSAVPADSGCAALAIYNRRRKIDSRERLLAAAMQLFCDRGYALVSVDDIASAAGLSRMTLYRHFGGKSDLAVELFRCTAKAAEPRLLAIGDRDYRDHAVIAGWIGSLFELDRANRHVVSVFIQANAESGFNEGAHQWLADVIRALGLAIPAFALERDRPEERRRWLEAWMLIYEILDQSNHAARDSGVSGDPLVIDILAERFRRFVNGPTECVCNA